MPRREENTVEAVRQGIKRRYKTGASHGSSRKSKKAEDENEFTKSDLEWKRACAAFLKASDYSYSYIADNLGVTKRMVKTWFEDETMQKRVESIRADMISGAISLGQTYTIEAVEGIAEIARRTDDDNIALRAWNDLLDRFGIAKVSKSQSVATKRKEVAITDGGLLEKIEGMPLETQQALAALAEEAETMIQAAKGKE